jgi:hypothetical protein
MMLWNSSAEQKTTSPEYTYFLFGIQAPSDIVNALLNGKGLAVSGKKSAQPEYEIQLLVTEPGVLRSSAELIRVCFLSALDMETFSRHVLRLMTAANEPALAAVMFTDSAMRQLPAAPEPPAMLPIPELSDLPLYPYQSLLNANEQPFYLHVVTNKVYMTPPEDLMSPTDPRYPWLIARSIKSDEPFYFNVETREINQHDPVDARFPWIPAVDPDTGASFYVNTITNQTTTEDPLIIMAAEKAAAEEAARLAQLQVMMFIPKEGMVVEQIGPNCSLCYVRVGLPLSDVVEPIEHLNVSLIKTRAKDGSGIMRATIMLPQHWLGIELSHWNDLDAYLLSPFEPAGKMTVRGLRVATSVLDVPRGASLSAEVYNVTLLCVGHPDAPKLLERTLAFGCLSDVQNWTFSVLRMLTAINDAESAMSEFSGSVALDLMPDTTDHSDTFMAAAREDARAHWALMQVEVNQTSKEPITISAMATVQTLRPPVLSKAASAARSRIAVIAAQRR